MKLRRTFVSALVLGAMTIPTGAIADDVHIVINTKHVMKSGTQKLKVSGQLHLISGPDSCTNGRLLKVQRKTPNGWNGLGQTTTNGNGNYGKVVADKTGNYRVVAPATGSCEKDVSASKNHSH